jgi:O-antigen ligase
MINTYVEKYFLILFSIIPLSIIIGSTISIINLALIVLSFLILMAYQKNWKWLFHPVIKLLFVIYLYLIFNSYISLNPEMGIYRNLGFFRFIILFAAFNYFFYHSKNFKFVMLIWLLTISVVFVDVFVELYSGRNIMNNNIKINGRVVSFFIDEPIVGGYLNAFYLILIGYIFSNNQIVSILKNNYLTIFISVIFLALIILTGERSNGIKALSGFFIFYSLFFGNNIDKKKVFLLLFLLTLLFSFLSQDKNLRYRYFEQYYSNLTDPTQTQADSSILGEFKKRNIYFNLYKSGYRVFKNNPIFGVGNKNYRIESCSQNNLENKYLCTTHPHQLYFEFLAEHGLVGTVILLSIIFYLFFKNIKILYLNKNAIQIGSFCYLLCLFIPMLPSGAFFNDYNLTLFWINFSILYASNPKTNIIKS